MVCSRACSELQAYWLWTEVQLKEQIAAIGTTLEIQSACIIRGWPHGHCRP